MQAKVMPPPPPPQPVAKSWVGLPKGQVQMAHLREHLLNGSLWTGQGKFKGDTTSPARPISYNPQGTEVLDAIRQKLHKASTVDPGVFEYLRHQAIKSTPEEIADAIQLLIARFGECQVAQPGKEGSYSQTKIACGCPPNPSDIKNKKQRGLVQIQSYNIARLVAERECKTDGDLAEALKHATERKERTGAHKCKRASCKAVKHSLAATDVVNMKLHETCPAFYIIQGMALSLCLCAEAFEDRCLVPGPLYNSKAGVERMEELVDLLNSDL